jgi:hypothetical protein
VFPCMHAGRHGEAKRCICCNFCCKRIKMIISDGERVMKKEVTRCLTHQACRRNGRCLGHPGRNHHSGMGGTRTRSHLSRSVALWSPVYSYTQTSLACWHRCRHAHTEIPAHTHLCPHCSPPPCSHLHRNKCKSR